MTAKRFTMKGSTILENDEEITAWDCCDLLNEQDKKIQQLLELLAFIHQMKKCNDNCSVEDYINKCFKG